MKIDRCDRCGAVLRSMTPEQHSAVEMVYADIADQLDWPQGSGVKRTPWEWHQLMVAAYAQEQGWQPIFLPSLNGEPWLTMVTRTKQSRLTKRQGSELIEFAKGWAIRHDVELHDVDCGEEIIGIGR